MNKYVVTIGGSDFEIEAEDESSIPDIVEEISKNSSIGLGDTELQNAVNESQQPYAKRLSALNNVIKERESAVTKLSDTVKGFGDVINPKPGILGVAGQAAEQTPAIQAMKVAMPIAELYGQLSESPLANIMLEVLEKPKETIGGFATSGFMAPQITSAAQKGITGEKRGEFGDVLRAAGVPEPIAAAGGLAAAVMLDPLGIKQKGAKIGAETVEKTGRNIARKSARKNVRWETIGGERMKVFKRNLSQIEDDLMRAAEEKYSQAMSGLEETATAGAKRLKERLVKVQAKEAAKLEIAQESLSRTMNPNASPVVVRGKLNKFFRENSDIYGKRIDQLSDLAEASGKGFSMQNMIDILEGSINTAIEEGMGDDRVTKKMASLLKKYQKASEGGMSFPFKAMRDDYKSIRNAGKHMQDVSDIFSKQWVEAAKELVPGFSILQQEYAPIMKMKEYAQKAYKLFGNEYNTKSVESFIKRAADGSLSAGEQKLLVDLAKDNPGFSKGIDGLLKNTMAKKRFNDKLVQEAKAGLDEINKRIASVDMLIERKQKGAALEKAKLMAEKKRYLDHVRSRAREGRMLFDSSSEIKRNSNWVKGIAGSILIYELVTRPVRGAMYRAWGGDDF